jgi:2,4-dienoyl-CoA reductase-like NADH-dependent reductase (Old Yellow Enzyme family)
MSALDTLSFAQMLASWCQLIFNMTKRGPKSNRRSEAEHETGDSRPVFVYNSPMSDENRASILLAPVQLGRLTIANRFVRSATQDYMARDEGEVTDRQVGLFRILAEGEIGLIITGHAYVHPLGKAGPNQIAIFDDRFVPGLSRIADAVHGRSSKVFVQLAHAGRQTKKRYVAGTPVSPSAVPDPVSRVSPREMTAGEIEALIGDFVRAGLRARDAGFDGVQLHAAHGYLLSSFLSPHTNRRTDEWGGPLPNRVRVIVEILRGVKEAAGRDFPVIAKLNTTDFLTDGLMLDDAVEAARLLEVEGLDGIEVSGGMAESGKGSVWTGVRIEADEGYFVENAAAVKRAVHIPVSGLGGIRTLAAAERFVAEGRVDLISMSRPFIRDPFLVRRFREGAIDRSDCISCNKCFNLRGIRCAQK